MVSDAGGPAHPCICGQMVKHGTIHMCDAMEPGPISIDDDPRFKFVPPQSMALLDYFAGQALAGIMSNSPFYEKIVNTAKAECLRDEDVVAHGAYELSEAMIAEKRRREES